MENSDFVQRSTNVSSYQSTSSQPGLGLLGKKVKRYFRKSQYLPFAIVGVLVLLIASLSINILMKKSSSSSSSVPSVLPTSDKRANIEKPRAQQILNRSFLFPLKDQAGKEVSKLKYEIQNIELRDQIIVKGEKATAVKGRTFLIINLKITNNYNKAIQLNARDYLRLIVSGSTEKLAPDIHNDPVEVQAISTKYTRLGFPINDTDTNLTLQVGEIEGKKELIPLTFK